MVISAKWATEAKESVFTTNNSLIETSQPVSGHERR